MITRLNFQLSLLVCIIAATTNAQTNQSCSLDIGDTAPSLKVGEWIKGKPFQSFKKGSVYVLEFWATWCKPCIAAMPHLSALAREYNEKVTILGINIYERKTTRMERVKAFVDSMGHQMDYLVAVDDSNFMVYRWIEAMEEQDNGIPRTFVVDAEGRLAWVGHPTELHEVLRKLMNNSWDVKEAAAKRNLNRHLSKLDKEVNYDLMRYESNPNNKNDLGKPDSVLVGIGEIVKKEPKLKYAPFVAHNTFSALLKTDMQKAYEYGKEVLVTPTYQEPAYDAIIGSIEWYLDKLILPAKIYQLGAEAYEIKIAQIPYPEIVNIPKLYNNMADMYWRAKNKSKTIDAMQKAIDALKKEKNYSKTALAAFQSRLQQYKNM